MARKKRYRKANALNDRSLGRITDVLLDLNYETSRFTIGKKLGGSVNNPQRNDGRVGHIRNPRLVLLDVIGGARERIDSQNLDKNRRLRSSMDLPNYIGNGVLGQRHVLRRAVHAKLYGAIRDGITALKRRRVMAMVELIAASVGRFKSLGVIKEEDTSQEERGHGEDEGQETRAKNGTDRRPNIRNLKIDA